MKKKAKASGKALLDELMGSLASSDGRSTSASTATGTCSRRTPRTAAACSTRPDLDSDGAAPPGHWRCAAVVLNRTAGIPVAAGSTVAVTLAVRYEALDVLKVAVAPPAAADDEDLVDVVRPGLLPRVDAALDRVDELETREHAVAAKHAPPLVD